MGSRIYRRSEAWSWLGRAHTGPFTLQERMRSVTDLLSQAAPSLPADDFHEATNFFVDSVRSRNGLGNFLAPHAEAVSSRRSKPTIVCSASEFLHLRSAETKRGSGLEQFNRSSHKFVLKSSLHFVPHQRCASNPAQGKRTCARALTPLPGLRRLCETRIWNAGRCAKTGSVSPQQRVLGGAVASRTRRSA